MQGGTKMLPLELAQALGESIQQHHDLTQLNPQNETDLQTLARWGHPFGIFEGEARAAHEARHGKRDLRPRLPIEEIAGWIRESISPYPDLFRDKVEACKVVQRQILEKHQKRLESCGTVWWQQLVVRVFWLDAKGKARLRRQLGIHRCKHAWCPTCGRSRQARFTAEVEKIMILAKELGLGESNARLVTLTVPNGPNIHDLRSQAHQAFAKLQRTRWWNRQAFGWVRGSEVVSGEDGNWNLHIHLLVLFWARQVSYAELGRVWTQELGGPRPDGKRYVMDCESLEAYLWKRKDGKKGSLKHRGDLSRAARYITKYLTKAEELTNLKSGPGGLAHLFGATNGLRKFSIGAGCALLRKAAKVLMPTAVFQAEEALAGTYLHEGRPPCLVEYLDPATGEVVEAPKDRLEDPRTKALIAWGESLETNPIPLRGQTLPGHVIGIPAGRKGRYRMVGRMPMSGKAPTVKAFEKFGTAVLSGIRARVAGGDWKVFRWEEISHRTGKVLRFAAVLPRGRYAWSPVKQALQEALVHGTDAWNALRQAANRAGAEHLIQDIDRLDALRAVSQSLAEVENQNPVLVSGF